MLHIKAKHKMSNPHDAPENGKPETNPIPELPWSNASPRISAATADPNTYPPSLPTQMYRSQNFVPAEMTPPSINQFTIPLFTQRLPEANGVLSTSHLYEHQARTSFQQQQSRSPGLSMDTEELLNRALYETQQQLYQRQLDQDQNQNPEPDHWQDQFIQDREISHLVPYHSPTYQSAQPASQPPPTAHRENRHATSQSLQYASAQGQRAQEPPVTANRQSPVSPSPYEQISNQYWQQGSSVHYHHHHSPNQLQHLPTQGQTEKVPSRKYFHSDPQNQPSSEPQSLSVNGQNEKKPSQKRSRRDSQSQLKSQPKQSEEEPSQKRPRRESQSQRKSQPQEQSAQNTSIPAPIPGQPVFHAEPASEVSPKVPFFAQDEVSNFASILIILPISISQRRLSTRYQYR